MRIFSNVAAMTNAVLPQGIFVMTKGYTTAGDGKGAFYLIASPQAVDGVVDHTIANTNVALYQGQQEQLPSPVPIYTVATLPAVATYTASLIYVSDETGGPTMAFSDGTNWRRVQDYAIVS